MSEETKSGGDETQQEAKQIQVRFVPSPSNKFLPVAPDTPFAVPASLARLGLSELVNHLLNQDPPQPYEFLIDNKFLRTSLQRYLTVNNLSGEGELVLEYIEALPPPHKDHSTPHPDWISSVDAGAGVGSAVMDVPINPTKKNSKTKRSSCPVTYAVTGCYDSIVRVWAEALKTDSSSTPLSIPDTSSATPINARLMAQGIGHTSAIKSVRVVRPSIAPLQSSTSSSSSTPSALIATASLDRTARLWSYDPISPTSSSSSSSSNDTSSSSNSPSSNVPTLTASMKCLGIFLGHQGTVETVESLYSPDRPSSLSEVANYSVAGPQFLTGGWDQTVRLWWASSTFLVNGNGDNTEDIDEAILSAAAEFRPTKRAKAENGSAVVETPIYRPASTLTGHTGCVSAIEWPTTSSCYSAGHDRTIRLWDLQQTQQVHAVTDGHVVCALSFSHSLNLLASGDQDGALRIWDPRVASGSSTSTLTTSPTSGSSGPKTVLRSHPVWCVQVKWAPAALGIPHILASASYDGTVKIWDIRSAKPLHTYVSSSDRLFGMSYIPAEVPSANASHANCSILVGGTAKTLDQVSWRTYI